MAGNSLNKSTLHKEQNQLALYNKVLPSLDLKRKQLLFETARAKKDLELLRSKKEEFAIETAQKYPMLSGGNITSLSPVKIKHVDMTFRNVMGVHLPKLEGIEFYPADYSVLGSPLWMELIGRRLKRAANMEVETEVVQRSIWLLERALKKITQRVNLFEKVLIPQSKERIKKIAVALEDIQRSGVIRSKIAKAKHLKEPL